jgi:hypothetical protein
MAYAITFMKKKANHGYDVMLRFNEKIFNIIHKHITFY